MDITLCHASINDTEGVDVIKFRLTGALYVRCMISKLL